MCFFIKKDGVKMKNRYFTDDKLERKRYAAFLNTIILNSDRYKRELSEKSYVIAVDSSWGTGKTYFTDMFENFLMGYDGPDTQNSNDSYLVIRFDAWKNDFWNNAFEPFVSTILENEIFYSDIEAENAGSLLKNLLVSSAAIAKGIVKKKVEDYIDPDSLDEAIQQSAGSMKDFLQHNNSLFGQFKEFQNEIENFKECLSEIVRKDRKIVVIIDELDRCKPTFAVQLLEIVKHLFDVNGLTFLFMLDIEQLSHSIKTIYGYGMDATGYLCRFFDYITRMPKPNMRQYIINSMERISLYDNCGDKDFINFIDFFTDISGNFDLSLRDIDTIICSYKIMLDSFLREYEFLDAHCQYLFYLVLKYKDAEEFNNVFLKNKPSEKIVKLSFNESSSIKESIGNITKLIEDLEYKIISEYNKDGLKGPDGYYKIYCVKEGKIYLKYRQGSCGERTIDVSSDVRLNSILFAPDIKKWEEIKDMEYGRYIHQQLEMFNFVESEYRNE